MDNAIMSKNKANLKVNIDLKLLQELEKNVGEKYFVKVGILAGKAQQKHGKSGITNVELGLIHEFGSVTRNIPQRSFLRFPLEFKGRAITKLLEKKKEEIARAITEGRLREVYANLGLICEKIIQQAFESGGFGQWAKLKPQTIKAKKSTSILIDTAQLRRSITSKVVKKDG